MLVAQGKIKFGVPQGSILETLLFNICDLFFILNSYDIVSYADGRYVIEPLKKVSTAIFKWFSDNQMQGNADKFHILISTEQKVHVNIVTAQI